MKLLTLPNAPLLPCHRLLQAWSFQSKLGIISNTIILAAPQLAHLLFVIFNAVALFALLSYLGLGQRVPYASSYAASFEETFSSLLGLGYVKMPDVFPDNLAQSAPQMLLSLIIFYGREVFFVMILMQFFMTTLGSQFMELKARAAQAKASSIPQDVASHVLPELKTKAVTAFRHAQQLRLRRKQAVAPAGSNNRTGGDGSPAAVEAIGPSNSGSSVEQKRLHAGAEALLGFLSSHFPGFISRKGFGDKVSAISIAGQYLDLERLQQLFAELAVQTSSQTLLQSAPARAFTHHTADAASAEASSSSSCTDPAASAEAAAARLPPVGKAAVAAGAPAAAVAAALAAAEQLLGSCGEPVDAAELQQARLHLEQLGQLDVAALQHAEGDNPEAPSALRPGQDYTVEVRAVKHGQLQGHDGIMHPKPGLLLRSCSSITLMNCSCQPGQSDIEQTVRHVLLNHQSCLTRVLCSVCRTFKHCFSRSCSCTARSTLPSGLQ